MISAAAHILALEASPGGLALLAEAMKTFSGRRLQALRRGLELAERPEPLVHLRRECQKAKPSTQAALLEWASFRGLEPACDLESLASTDVPSLQKAVMGAARYGEREAAKSCTCKGYDYADPAARNAAIETGLILGEPDAWGACKHYAQKDGRGSGRLMVLLACLGKASDQAPLYRCIAHAKLGPAAIWALGFAGTVTAAQACIDCMKKGLHVELAAEAFCAMTGLDLAGHGLTEQATAPGADAGAGESKSSDGTSEAADLGLPKPQVPGVVRWWEAHEKEFARDGRYVAGRRADLLALQHALEHSPTRRRHALATELAIRTQGACTVQTRAFTDEQHRQMASLARGSAIGKTPGTPLARYFSNA